MLPFSDSLNGRGTPSGAQRLLPGTPHEVRTRRGELSVTLAYVLQEVQKEAGLEAAASEGSALAATGERESLVTKVAARLGFELTNFERDEIVACLERDDKPFGILQGLVEDVSVTDIIITNFSKISVRQGRKNVSTSISFPSQEAYEAFVERLLKKAGTTYSTKKPITDGMIGAFARIHAVNKVLCESGPYVTIRLNRFSAVACDDLLENGVAPKAVLDYLTSIVSIGRTLLIVGEVGSGKTTLARALMASVPPDEAILVIEDTPEIRLEHPHVRYITTRDVNTDEAGRVAPSECIRGGMRMAMHRIVFGEIRDAEAAEAFIDVCSSGHPGLSTLHARSVPDSIARLLLFLGRVQKGVPKEVLCEQIATAVQVIVHVDICKITGKRRIMNVQEIGPVADGVLRHREMFSYQLQARHPAWSVKNRVSAFRDEIEALSNPVRLSQMPPVLELPIEVSYREGAQLNVR